MFLIFIINDQDTEIFNMQDQLKFARCCFRVGTALGIELPQNLCSINSCETMSRVPVNVSIHFISTC